MKDRPIIVHSLKDAQAALDVAAELGLPITLRSAPGAARYLGASVFREMIAEACGQYPDLAVTSVFDCGDDPGLALGALRDGLKVIRLNVSGDALDRIADIAAETSARVEAAGKDEGEEGPVLDLLDLDDPEAALRTWLTDDG
jgi:fructose/tagatose bisphosphate aldolase